MSTLDPRHPGRELLLPYLDGELPLRQARRVRRHVEACWGCRSELEELQKTVGECVRYRRQLEDGAWPQPPQPWSDLAREFARIDASARRSPLSRPFIRWAALAASAAALVAATLTYRTWERHPAGDAPELRPQNPAHKKPQDAPSPPAGTAAARTEALVPSARTRAPESKPLVIEASVADELRAVAALHQLGADLGDPVEVAREGGRVVVRGAGLSPLLERQIREAFISLPGIELRFPEPGAGGSPPSIPAGTEAPPPGGAATAATPVPSATQNHLEEQLGGHAQFEIFSSQLLDHQEAAMARIYALRRLATQFPANEEGQLNAGDQRLLHDLGREHVQALSRELAAIQRVAGPVLGSISASATPSVSGAAVTWQATAEDLLAAGRQMDSLIAPLIGASAPEPALQARNPSQALASALAQIRLAVQQCELILTR
jgi:putative zinc finger protein